VKPELEKLARHRLGRAKEAFAEGEHILPRAFEKRQKSDYGDFSTVTKKEAKAVRADVSGFIEECEQVLERLIAEEE
jgi:uncharacterized protein (UPF0332 family)